MTQFTNVFQHLLTFSLTMSQINTGFGLDLDCPMQALDPRMDLCQRCLLFRAFFSGALCFSSAWSGVSCTRPTSPSGASESFWGRPKGVPYARRRVEPRTNAWRTWRVRPGHPEKVTFLHKCFVKLSTKEFLRQTGTVWKSLHSLSR